MMTPFMSGASDVHRIATEWENSKSPYELYILNHN